MLLTWFRVRLNLIRAWWYAGGRCRFMSHSWTHLLSRGDGLGLDDCLYCGKGRVVDMKTGEVVGYVDDDGSDIL